MQRKERRGSIERKILTSILWVGITPISLALVAGYIVVHEAQRKAVMHDLSNAAQRTVSGLNLALNPRLRTVRRMAQDPEIVAALKTSGEGRSLDALKARLEADALSADPGDGPSVYSLYDPFGKLLLSTDPVIVSSDSEDVWVAQVQDAQVVDYKYSLERNQYFVQIVAPVYEKETKKILGFLSEHQGVYTLINYALGQAFGAADGEPGMDRYQMAYVSDKRGAALISFLDPVQTPPLQTKTADPKLQSRLLNPNVPKEAGAMRLWSYATGQTNKDVLLAYRYWFGRENEYRMYVVVCRPAVTAFGTLNAWAAYTMLGGALVIAVFCLVAYRNVHNNIARPIALLNEGAQIIRQGDLELKLKIFTGDEIEELASSFNKMALELNQNIRQLEDSEEKYRSLVTSMRDGVYQTDSTGVFAFLNPAGAEIFGFDHPEDAIGVPLRSLFLEDIDFVRVANEVGKQSFVDRVRIWMKRRDGRSICVELSANSVLDDEGRVGGAEGIFRDVTSSVRLEQQARERAERISAINQIANVINSSLEAGLLHESLVAELRKLVDFDFASVALLDDSGGGAETRQLWPELAGSRRFALEQEGCASWVARERRCLRIENLPEESPEFVHEFPEDTNSLLCVPLYATGRIIGTLNLGAARRAAFSRHDMEVLEEMAPHIAVAIRNAGLLEHLQQSLDEVTRAREKLHEANEELKTLDEMKTNLLSNVSHELRTPLVAVMGYTDMILNSKVGGVNDTQREYLGIIMRNVEKLVTLIENLLDFSRLHEGKEKLIFDSFDLLECARTSMQTVQPVADSRNIKLELVASDDRVLVEGDRGKMGQVFNNLLSNAVKFNQNGGRVTIEVRNREDSIEVSVSDTGIGIPPEALDKVFTRFYQYDSSSTRKYGGTGIGLSIAQDIARLHGSRITVTSEVGKGTCFRFTLPKTHVDREQLEEEAGLHITCDTGLLVEVVSLDRGLIAEVRDLLLPEGIDVVQASTPENARRLLERYKPDCVLLDARPSPEGDGLAVRFLEGYAQVGTPIVLLTNDDDICEKYRSMAASRIKRGFRKSGLLSALRYAINPRSSFAEPLGGKILCVDDDPEVIGFITRCLAAEGFPVDACGSGEEALEKIAGRQYGLVLLDIAMPGVDGWEVCRRVRADASLAALKIYFVTAKPIDRISSRIQDVNADGYLLKPFKPEELAELVRGVLVPSETRDT